MVSSKVSFPDFTYISRWPAIPSHYLKCYVKNDFCHADVIVQDYKETTVNLSNQLSNLSVSLIRWFSIKEINISSFDCRSDTCWIVKFERWYNVYVWLHKENKWVICQWSQHHDSQQLHCSVLLFTDIAHWKNSIFNLCTHIFILDL